MAATNHMEDYRSGNSTPQVNPPPRDDYDDDDDDNNSYAPEGFDEIEKAFSRVAMFADDLLETIQDDSLRSERKRDKNKKKLQAVTSRNSSRSPTGFTKRATTTATTPPTASSAANYVTDSDDDQINTSKERHRLEEDVVHTHTQSYYNRFDQREAGAGYRHNNKNHDDDDEDDDDIDVSNNSYSQESDVSSLDMTFGGAFDGDGEESIDGSLVHDVVNLKSKTKAMRAEMLKQEEAFLANVTEGCDGKPFFQKMEDASAAAAAQRERYNNTAAAAAAANARTPKMKNSNFTSSSSRPTTISVRKKGGSPPVLRSAAHGGDSRGQQQQQLKLRISLFVEQLKLFCDHQLVGSNSRRGGPNLPLILVSFGIWFFLLRLLLGAKTGGLIDGTGYLR